MMAATTAARPCKVNEYLRKHQLAPLQVEAAPETDLGMVVVIPCRDEPGVIETLASLCACQPPECAVEVLLVFNNAADADPGEQARNARDADRARAYAASPAVPEGLRIHVLEFPGLEPRQAGVGLARRLGMDEAVARLDWAGRGRAPIVGLDADCRVAPGYLRAVAGHFREHPRCQACSIYFEHPLEGSEAAQVYRAIAEYELYLRYFRLGLVRAGYPHAHHTLGSCMAVRASAYQACGGMNRRQAAEDFHFLTKLMLQGGYSYLTATTVYPGARPSHRVPFGTGHAVARRLRESALPVYAPEVFEAVAELVAAVEVWAHKGTAALPAVSESYFLEQGLLARLEEVRRETASARAFAKRFYRWLSPLALVKFANHLSAGPCPRIPVAEAAGRLLEGRVPTDPDSLPRLLQRYRELEKAGSRV